ncbi:hypothetical protein [Roseateles aquae]|nr:hypothetical protein [Paucibacter sp. APW11]
MIAALEPHDSIEITNQECGMDCLDRAIKTSHWRMGIEGFKRASE